MSFNDPEYMRVYQHIKYKERRNKDKEKFKEYERDRKRRYREYKRSMGGLETIDINIFTIND